MLITKLPKASARPSQEQLLASCGMAESTVSDAYKDLILWAASFVPASYATPHEVAQLQLN